MNVQRDEIGLSYVRMNEVSKVAGEERFFTFLLYNDRVLQRDVMIFSYRFIIMPA